MVGHSSRISPAYDQPRAGAQPTEGAQAVRDGPSLPTVSLPKGGGAIRGMGEKFAANPVTGTGSLSVPIATSPGRSGFGPQLSLSYDSGAGNGPFGFGWNLSLPSITRKTEKGLPKYHDAEESDVFILSGAEDLVPTLVQDVAGKWVPEVVPDRTINNATYKIKRYRPRIEGLFARIERWTNESNPKDSFWRSISKDNITTWYGKTDESRITDPDDSARIFSWLICESYDDKGNAIRYEYKAENSDGINPSLVHERNRTDKSRSTNRYLKHIKYGNKTPRLANEDLSQRNDWLFEVAFDYGEHYSEDAQGQPTSVFIEDNQRLWQVRQDPFSAYRAGFEVRTYRLCRRVLMFHHFPNELGIQDYLVRATHFTYNESPVASFITSTMQSGYVRKQKADGTYFYLKKSLPPLEFDYSQATIKEEVRNLDAESLENLPIGLDGTGYQWVDLDGEGLSGILTEQAEGWFYKRNLSPISVRQENGKEITVARFGPLELVATTPSLADVASGRQQFLDLAGDGQLDLVQLERPMAGFYERTHDERWEQFTPFASCPNVAWNDPNLKFVDLTGDGHADVLITQDQAFIWYESLAEEGFGSAQEVRQALDEEKGPRLIFADGTQSIYLADISGDGLSDLVRIRNGEVCYWPNLGYGRFGTKVTMDQSPHFDNPDQFDHKRIRLADIDGSGVTDIIYLGGDGVRLYLNQSGNRWSKPHRLEQFPPTDNLSSVMAADLLGNGTACLVWSSPLPAANGKPLRYIDLMGGQKPHLLTKVVNNLGAETQVHYAPSTKFYLKDKENGKPWITRLHFPVHVVERVETYDYISRNRFVTTYAYHHGYFDGVEREFRGFGTVEQRDTEEFEILSGNGNASQPTNVDKGSHVPPVLTRTWFHTGSYLQRLHISRHFESEYFQLDPNAELLPDTVLPTGLTVEEEREACRALKGSMLRQEIYARDGTDKEERPYTVTEQNFTIRRLQPHYGNRHAVFFTHPREAINYQYERNPPDPRIGHALTLEVDPYGNVLKEVAIGYGRRQPDATLPLQADRDKQTQRLITYTENRVTNDITAHPDDYRTPLPCETRTYELTGYPPTGAAGRFRISDFVQPDPADPSGRKRIHIFDGEVDYEDDPPNGSRRRLIEHLRTLYRPNDLGVSLMNDPLALLPLETVESLALPGETYKLAFTPGLIDQVYDRNGQKLIPNRSAVLQGAGDDKGGYVDLDGDDHWWIPSGRVFLSPDSAHTPAQERSYAQNHLFLPHRYRDPFHTESLVSYDTYDLLIQETRDAFDNRVTVGERLLNGNLDPTKPGNDYRVLQPRLLMDPNRNRSAVAFDALGLVVGTAVMGKPEEDPQPGDSLDNFDPDPPDNKILAHLEHPLGNPNPPAPFDPVDPHTMMQKATTRLIYDLFAYHRTKNQGQPQPAVVYTMARETHTSDLKGSEKTKIQHSISYSDGFGREIQKKIQAEPGPVPRRDANGKVIVGPDRQPEMTQNDVTPRWVGSGWTIFNNKGKPVRQYEPFFTDTHRFEFDVRIGVSPVLFYDPAERVVATLHPNHTYEKVVFDPWQQTTWDVNDTVRGDPRTDAGIQGYTAGYFASLPASPPAPPWQTWYTQRQGGALGPQEQAAAIKAAAHANTPTTASLDALGRPFLTEAHNKVVCAGHDLDGTEDKFHTRVELDIEGNQRAVKDERKKPDGTKEQRIVMRYDYYMAGPEENENGATPNRIHQASMEAGERWILNDVAGNPIRAWDSRGHEFRTAYDQLRRPIESRMSEGAGPELLVGRTVYGETRPTPEAHNLRGQVVQLFDQAGVVTTDPYDFKGNLLSSRRQLAQEYKTTLNWSATVPLEAATYTSRTTYDALNRPVSSISPDGSIYLPTFNEANLLERVDANLRGAMDAVGQPVWTPFVTNIDYDAKGQRTLIEYGNVVQTKYEYDPKTFRLTHLLTKRDAAAFPNDCPNPPPTNWPGCQVQNLHYTYDPVGNISHIRDDAQQTIYFKNKRVEPSAEYTYDAIYRLIQATGREHLGQGGTPIPHSHNDAERTGLLTADAAGRFSPSDGNAMGRYCEKYVYDAVGNFLQMSHHRSCPDIPSWTRIYTYDEASLIEPAKQSNRLSSTALGNNNPSPDRYVHDAHGNMTRMPHLGGAHPTPNLHWDHKDQLRQADLGGGGTAYYTYDSAGQRVRKVIESQNGSLKSERIYLSGFEIYKQHSGIHAGLERETLHIMDGQQRIALVETRTQGTDPAPAQLIRYQFGNHLGSASMELDDQAHIISYEEYTPYGSTSYQAVRNQTETPKRYRYTGKERDEENGLYYYGARYYAAWLGRWTIADPVGLADGTNVYSFTNDSPASNIDRSGYGTTSSGGAEEETHPTIQDITKYQKSGSAVVAAPRQIGRKRNIRRIIGVVLHITRGGPARNAIRQVTDEDRRTRASFHTVIDRTGKPTHVVPYEYASFHAGGAFEVLLETRKGAFKGKTIRSINSRTIGIEIANYGPLVKVGDRTFKLKEKQLDPETGNRIPLDTPILGQDLTGKDIELVDTGQKKRVDVGEGRTETLRVYHEKITDAQYETLVQELIAISKLEIPLNLIGHRHLSEKSLKPDPPWRPFLQRLENDEQLKNRGVVTYPDPLSIQDAWGFD